MKSTVNRLESSFLRYPERLQRRLLSELTANFPAGSDPSGYEVLEQIKIWLTEGIDAPTARQSAHGWHKKFELRNFAVEGEGGSVHIQWILRLRGLRRPLRGVDLDDLGWKDEII